MSRKHLTLTEKSEILKQLSDGVAVTFLAKKYDVAKSTICSIHKKREAITAKLSDTCYGTSKRKTLRLSELPIMEKRLYKWFLEQRKKHVPVCGLALKQKAIAIITDIDKNESGFVASDGWLQNFKQRYGVRYLKITGEKLSSQIELVCPFKKKLREKMLELQLTKEQLYNADEIGLYWKLLPEKTYVASSEKTAPGRKPEKQRITFLECANATGHHKVKPLVIGKAQKPRCFKNVSLPVHYRNSKSAWMTSAIFKEWFHTLFVPEVQRFLRQNGLPIKALLILDNAPCHPPESELQTPDGGISVMYMPPNVTPLIQPMDQNAIRLTKLFYRKNLLISIAASEKDNICEAVKEVSIKDAVFNLAAAWDKLEASVIAKCWENVLSMEEDLKDDFEDEDDLPLSVVRNNLASNANTLATKDVLNLLNHLTGLAHTAADLLNWNDDQESSNIEEEENENENEKEQQPDVECPISSLSSRDAVQLFEKALEWATSNKVDYADILVLKRLQEKAMLIDINSKKKQTKMTTYFSTA